MVHFGVRPLYGSVFAAKYSRVATLSAGRCSGRPPDLSTGTMTSRPRIRCDRESAGPPGRVDARQRGRRTAERRPVVSFRQISTVAAIERSRGRILWRLGPPLLNNQHAPAPLANGNLLIFDNGTHRLDDHVPYLRVIEVDPGTKQVLWSYQDTPASGFFSPLISNAQRLPNGNTEVLARSN
jgi:hypothetical protein